MRHHFTKSERLALKVMAALYTEFTDMESGPIRKGKWLGVMAYRGCPERRRSVSRVVSFTIDDPSFPLHAGVKVILRGSEVGELPRAAAAVIPASLETETTWRVDKIMMGYHFEEKGVVWHQLHIPGKEEPFSDRFPHHLMERSSDPVASADA